MERMRRVEIFKWYAYDSCGAGRKACPIHQERSSPGVLDRFQVNLGVISALVGKDDIVIIDKMDHASIIDGCRLSYGDVKKVQT